MTRTRRLTALGAFIGGMGICASEPPVVVFWLSAVVVFVAAYLLVYAPLPDSPWT